MILPALLFWQVQYKEEPFPDKDSFDLEDSSLNYLILCEDINRYLSCEANYKILLYEWTKIQFLSIRKEKISNI